MKKLICTLIACLLLVGLMACTQDSPPKETEANADTNSETVGDTAATVDTDAVLDSTPATETVPELESAESTETNTEPVTDIPVETEPPETDNGRTDYYISTDKTLYEVDEDIRVTMNFPKGWEVLFYQTDMIPGSDPSIYYDGFVEEEGYEPRMNRSVSLFDFYGQPYRSPGVLALYQDVVPAGIYKLLLCDMMNNQYEVKQEITITIIDEQPIDSDSDCILTMLETTLLKGQDILILADFPKGYEVRVYAKDAIPGVDSSIYYDGFEGEHMPTLREFVPIKSYVGQPTRSDALAEYHNGLPAGEYVAVICDAEDNIEKQMEFSVVDELFTMEMEKDTFDVGEEIFITMFFPVGYELRIYSENAVPGVDRSIYYQGYEGDYVPTMNEPVNVKDFVGLPIRAAELEPYWDGLIAGTYYVRIFDDEGKMCMEKTITVLMSEEEAAKYALSTNKTTYTVGEDIFVTMNFPEGCEVRIYTENGVPGVDPSVYYEGFENGHVPTMNVPVNIKDFVGPPSRRDDYAVMYPNGLIAGNYKVVICGESANIIKRVDIVVVDA